jgi:hypothetical protein
MSRWTSGSGPWWVARVRAGAAVVDRDVCVVAVDHFADVAAAPGAGVPGDHAGRCSAYLRQPGTGGAVGNRLSGGQREHDANTTDINQRLGIPIGGGSPAPSR